MLILDDETRCWLYYIVTDENFLSQEAFKLEDNH